MVKHMDTRKESQWALFNFYYGILGCSRKVKLACEIETMPFVWDTCLCKVKQNLFCRDESGVAS